VGGRPRIYEGLDDLAARESVARWLGTVSEGDSRRHAIYTLNRFIRWRHSRGLEDNPDGWVNECSSGTVKTLTDHLKVLQDYIHSDEFEGASRETRRKHYFRIRALYECNFVPLPSVGLRLPNGHEGPVRVQVTANDFLEMTRRVLSAGHLTVRDRAIVLVMLQSGMDASTVTEVFNYVGFPQLVTHFGTEEFLQWNTERCPVKVDLVRPKSDRRFYTFVDVDAVEALKDWLRVRYKYSPIKIEPANPGELPRSGQIFIDQYGNALTAKAIGHVFRDAGRRAGINVNHGPGPGLYKGARIRYGFHSHECRDVIKTLARGRADQAVAEFCLGHSIDKLRYDKSPWNDPEYFRREYLKISRPYLNPISGSVLQVRNEIEKEYADRLSRLENEMEELLDRKRVASMT